MITNPQYLIKLVMFLEP